jgi:hypothetical protein
MLRLKFLRPSHFETAARSIQHEDSDPLRAPWLPLSGSCPFACAGGMYGFTGVPNGDSGRGWRCRRGALCALAFALDARGLYRIQIN